MKTGDFVKIDYIGRLESGEIFDLTYEDVAKKEKIHNEKIKYKPVSIIVGAGFVIPGLDKAISEMELNEKKKIKIAPEEGFGKRNPDMVKVVPKNAFKGDFEPKPGRLYNDDETIYISPDIYVFKVGDDYEIVLNEDGMPKLRINSYYREILTSKNSLGKDTKEYIQEKLKSAAWLIKSIHQRHRTIYKVTESIVQFQRDFFDKGIAYLKPLVLRDVAERIQMHESTVSRVTTNKYIHTPQGIFELKFFFNSAVSSMEGESIASESVKEHIRNIVKSEDKRKPFSDQELCDILKKSNIDIARRTVAKYRETLGILPSRKRRAPY